MTSGHGEGCLFCVGLLAVLKGSPLPQSPTPTSGLLARVSTEFYLAGSHAWPLQRLSDFSPKASRSISIRQQITCRGVLKPH